MRNYGVKTQTLKIYIKIKAFQGSETKMAQSKTLDHLNNNYKF
jgi:hypothetical protein